MKICFPHGAGARVKAALQADGIHRRAITVEPLQKHGHIPFTDLIGELLLRRGDSPPKG